MRIKSRPAKVFQNYEEPQIEIKKELTQVDPLQVHNLRRNLRNISPGDRYDATANVKNEVFDYAMCKRGPEDDLNYVRHGIGDAKKKFKCNQCEYSTNAPINLTEHTNAHSGVKPNKCEHCDFSTSYKSNLYQHRKTHKGIKANKRGFATSNGPKLYKHRKTQSSDRAAKIKCIHCGYATWYRGKLKEHVNNVHLGIKDLKCKECNYQTSYGSNLRSHTK